MSGETCRLHENRCESRVHWDHNSQLSASAHFHPALALQLGWGSKLQVGCQFWTDRPWLKRHHRQDGFPPSGLRPTSRYVPDRLQVATDVMRRPRNAQQLPGGSRTVPLLPPSCIALRSCVVTCACDVSADYYRLLLIAQGLCGGRLRWQRERFGSLPKWCDRCTQEEGRRYIDYQEPGEED